MLTVYAICAAAMIVAPLMFRVWWAVRIGGFAFLALIAATLPYYLAEETALPEALQASLTILSAQLRPWLIGVAGIGLLFELMTKRPGTEGSRP
jgi:endonuclease/exonuclease/phosphatase (EEP) superfamily protein YafD